MKFTVKENGVMVRREFTALEISAFYKGKAEELIETTSPSQVIRNEKDGSIKIRWGEWFSYKSKGHFVEGFNNEEHLKNDQPSLMKFDKDGNLVLMAWFKDGQYHRENDEPAYITFYDNGGFDQVHWLIKDKEERVNKELPTRKAYYESGALEFEFWDNVREDGKSDRIHYPDSESK